MAQSTPPTPNLAAALASRAYQALSLGCGGAEAAHEASAVNIEGKGARQH